MMNLHIDVERVARAFGTVQSALLAERTVGGHWVGELGGSPSATAAAISALVVAHANGPDDLSASDSSPHKGANCTQLLQGDLSELIVEGLHWLAERQNPDGGWSDTERGRSSIAATLLVQSVFRLTCVPAKYDGLTDRADEFLESHGGTASLRKRFGRDKSLTAPVLANAALAGLLPWRQLPALPFEMACLPQDWFRRMHLPVASFALPLLVAVGQLKFHHDPPRNPLTRLLRLAARKRSLAALERAQADDGSFQESTPLTAFVVMSLASIGLAEHAIVRHGVEFLLASVRSDASWAMAPNLTVSNTVRAMTVLADRPADDFLDYGAQRFDENCLDWLLECHRNGSASPAGEPTGGWSWTDLHGAPTNTDDTARALLALAAWRDRCPHLKQHRLQLAARQGVEWLLAHQNGDGGWPPLERGWNVSTFDESAADLTAHAVQALVTWDRIWTTDRAVAALDAMQSAIARGLRFLEEAQRNDGSFVPLAFGNQHHPEGYNLVYGTAEVLALCVDLGRLDSDMAQRAARWLLGVQHANGGWGPPRTSPATSLSNVYRSNSSRAEDALAGHCSVEETALALRALLPFAETNQLYARAVQNGLKWLVEAVEQGRLRQPAPIGLRFGKLWYTERLHPLVFAAGALDQAVRQLAPLPQAVAPVA
jgi:squalene-hopene/tetraprenyl-beta-curcumene cyclase